MKITGSKNIAEIDHETFDGLRVTFQNGRTYRYPDVPRETYDALVIEATSDDPNASVGKAFNKFVRAEGYSYEEVTE